MATQAQLRAAEARARRSQERLRRTPAYIDVLYYGRKRKVPNKLYGAVLKRAIDDTNRARRIGARVPAVAA